jgi:hypothetical protein
LRPAVARRRAAKSNGISARRNDDVLCGIPDQIGMGPEARKHAFAQHPRSIQLAHGSMRYSHGWCQNDAAPALADLLPLFAAARNVIQCTDRRVAAT